MIRSKNIFKFNFSKLKLKISPDLWIYFVHVFLKSSKCMIFFRLHSTQSNWKGCILCVAPFQFKKGLKKKSVVLLVPWAEKGILSIKKRYNTYIYVQNISTGSRRCLGNQNSNAAIGISEQHYFIADPSPDKNFNASPLDFVLTLFL
jgi:hypothetical protein